MVEVETLALDDDLAVPLEAETGQRADDDIGSAGDAALRIDVLDTQQPLPAVGARVEIAADGGDQRTEMQRPSRRRREAAAVGRGGGDAWCRAHHCRRTRAN